MLTDDEWNSLTESRFFKAEIGEEYTLLIANTRMETVKFGMNGTPRSALVCDVLEENGRKVSKRLETSNPELCKYIRSLERDKPFVIHFFRRSKYGYDCVNPEVVRKATQWPR